MLIPRGQMSVLNPATDLKAVADDAKDDATIMSIAYSLNNAANTGEYSVVWLGEMNDTVKQKVENEGYTVEKTKLHTGEEVKDSWTISFIDAE